MSDLLLVFGCSLLSPCPLPLHFCPFFSHLLQPPISLSALLVISFVFFSSPVLFFSCHAQIFFLILLILFQFQFIRVSLLLCCSPLSIHLPGASSFAIYFVLLCMWWLTSPKTNKQAYGQENFCSVDGSQQRPCKAGCGQRKAIVTYEVLILTRLY